MLDLPAGQKQPATWAQRWTLRTAWAIWAAIAVFSVVMLLAASPAKADPEFRGTQANGGKASLVLHREQCEDAAVLKQLALQVKAEFIAQFRAATLTWEGKQWKSCWIAVDGVVFSIDEEGAHFQPTPVTLFRDYTI